MADAVGNKDAKNYYLDRAVQDTGFFAKGLAFCIRLWYNAICCEKIYTDK